MGYEANGLPLKRIRLTMIRPHLRNIPAAALPEPYAIRPFRRGDETSWAVIERAAGEFRSRDDALRRFRDEFGAHLDEMERRCLFVVDERSTPVGTTTAWYGELPFGIPVGLESAQADADEKDEVKAKEPGSSDFATAAAGRTAGILQNPGLGASGLAGSGTRRPVAGRIHWVAISPQHQGKKLAKPLLAEALRILALSHEQAYLTTQTTSYKAVNLYLDFGFVPLLRDSACEEGWKLMETALRRRIVAR